MDADMAGIRCDNPFESIQQCGDDYRVGLCPASQEKYICRRAFTGQADLFFCALAVAVGAISWQRLQIGFRQSAQNLFMSAL